MLYTNKRGKLFMSAEESAVRVRESEVAASFIACCDFRRRPFGACLLSLLKIQTTSSSDVHMYRKKRSLQKNLAKNRDGSSRAEGGRGWSAPPQDQED